jgi:hypothetical protein
MRRRLQLCMLGEGGCQPLQELHNLKLQQHRLASAGMWHQADQPGVQPPESAQCKHMMCAASSPQLRQA